nr:hypothetical protein [uncultured Moellerella sp.]
MKSKTKFSLILMLLIMVVFSAYLGWGHRSKQGDFECRARMHAKLIDNTCGKNSVMDVFLSMHHDGKGYFLVSGSHSCPKTESKSITGIINFTYDREGSYYSINMSQRSPDMIELFNGLKNDNIKIKITEMNNDNYIISSPIETFMLCTKS